jgi:hypothetical protein
MFLIAMFLSPLNHHAHYPVLHALDQQGDSTILLGHSADLLVELGEAQFYTREARHRSTIEFLPITPDRRPEEFLYAVAKYVQQHKSTYDDGLLLTRDHLILPPGMLRALSRTGSSISCARVNDGGASYYMEDLIGILKPGVLLMEKPYREVVYLCKEMYDLAQFVGPQLIPPPGIQCGLITNFEATPWLS